MACCFLTKTAEQHALDRFCGPPVFNRSARNILRRVSCRPVGLAVAESGRGGGRGFGFHPSCNTWIAAQVVVSICGSCCQLDVIFERNADDLIKLERCHQA